MVTATMFDVDAVKINIYASYEHTQRDTNQQRGHRRGKLWLNECWINQVKKVENQQKGGRM